MGDQVFLIAAFYKFTKISLLSELQTEFYEFLNSLGIKGTVLLAEEGINGTVSGSPKSIVKFKNFLFEKDLLSESDFKFSSADFMPFPRLKVKLKKEIVTIGDCEINPGDKVGEYVDPLDWNQLITEEDVLVLDTRNTYEVSIGSFEGAIQPETTNFREFPEWAETEGSKLPKDKKIAMFCTGGIRCEKASSLLKDKGFEKVYHLKGGILNYLEKVKPEESLWNGECFVFDDRVALNHKLEPGSYDLCHGCRMPITEDDKLSAKFIRGVSCAYCFDHKTEEQKRRYMDRQMQIDLAKSRNQKHIGSKREVEQK
jgi:UPF0176 protein